MIAVLFWTATIIRQTSIPGKKLVLIIHVVMQTMYDCQVKYLYSCEGIYIRALCLWRVLINPAGFIRNDIQLAEGILMWFMSDTFHRMKVRKITFVLEQFP